MTSNGLARKTLGPAELRLACQAFEAALAEVGESELHPYAIRKCLAQHVMQRIFAGEHDAARLRDGALESLCMLESKGSTQALHCPPNLSNENVRPLFVAKG